MHSFALTPRYVAIVEQPFVVNPLDFLRPDRPPIVANFRWKASQPSRVHLIDRRAAAVRATVELEPFFVFHHVNAYERGDRVVIDVCAHRDSSIIDALYLKRLRKGKARQALGPPPAPGDRSRPAPCRDARARRRRLRASADQLRPGQPAALPLRLRRRPAQPGRSRFIDQLAKVDVASGDALMWRERGCYPGEPVFVQRPGARREDDGVLLSVVLDARARSSFLLVLDARSMQERARPSCPTTSRSAFTVCIARRSAARRARLLAIHS